MAQSRLEKVGTIFSRISALLRTKAMKEENKPIWFDVYQAFPPKYEPRYDRKVAVTEIRPIFYAEDEIRAKFHSQFKNYSMVNLLDKNSVSKTEQFMNIYKELEKEDIPKDQIYDKAVSEFLTKVKSEKYQKESDDSSNFVQKPKFVKTKKTSHKIVSSNTQVQDSKESAEVLSTDQKNYKPIKLRLDKIMTNEEDSSLEKSK